MLARLIVAGLGIPFLLVILFWAGGWAFWAVSLLLGSVGVLEMAKALKQKGQTVEIIWPLLGSWLLLTAPVRGMTWGVALAGLVLLFLANLTVCAFRGMQQTFQSVSQNLFLALYPGLFAVPVALRFMKGEVRFSFDDPMEAGALWVFVALLFVWVTDSGAFFVGRAWGRRKLAPRLSPSKTLEGAAGGWAFAALLGLGLGYWTRGHLFSGPASGLFLGAFAGIVAQVGDLVESSIKRELGVKDFGGWLPGHGGALDRFDSFLFVCPLVYLWAHAVNRILF